MSADPAGPHAASPTELKERLEAERQGVPFMLLRAGDSGQIIHVLAAGSGAVSIGRESDNAIAVYWDHKVSRLHAVIEPAGSAWTIEDDGLSRNGTYVNHERLTGKRALRNGDVVTVGDTQIRYFAPSLGRDSGETVLSGAGQVSADVSRMQKQILVELCRPLHEKGTYASPASNQEIADAVHLSTVAVKAHLRTLFAKFGLADLPQNRKRAALAEAALRSGTVGSRDF